MQIDQSKIEQAIVAEAVDKFIGDDDIYTRIRDGINARIDKVFAEKVSLVIAETVERIVNEGFERTYHKTDSFGRPVGQPTSISKELETLVGNYWTERVDRNGKKTDSSYSSMSRAEWMMAQICADDFSKEMKQHVVNVAGALKDHFRGVLNEHIASMLSDVFRVQTAGDKAMKNNGGSAIIHPPAGPVGG
tara:strand:+ start:1262 stop:1834 length:573 start_codon:yes stop_codon:yes gene_type:complete